MYGTAFWKASAERALKTFAQTLTAYFGMDAFDVLDADWGKALALSAGAVVLSLLTSVGSAGVGGAGPSLANEVTSPPAPPIEDGVVNWLACIFVAVVAVALILLFGWVGDLNIGDGRG